MVLNLQHGIVSKVERMSTRSWRMVEINARAHKHLNIERKPNNNHICRPKRAPLDI